jgi:hypothetical protein
MRCVVIGRDKRGTVRVVNESGSAVLAASLEMACLGSPATLGGALPGRAISRSVLASSAAAATAVIAVGPTTSAAGRPPGCTPDALVVAPAQAAGLCHGEPNEKQFCARGARLLGSFQRSGHGRIPDVPAVRPGRDVDAWWEDQIWTELQARVAGAGGFSLKEGPIADKTLLRFHSFVAEPMRTGRLLASDAAYTVPPRGAKGLKLALADVRVLAEVLERAVGNNEPDALDEYGPSSTILASVAGLI